MSLNPHVSCNILGILKSIPTIMFLDCLSFKNVIEQSKEIAIHLKCFYRLEVLFKTQIEKIYSVRF